MWPYLRRVVARRGLLAITSAQVFVQTGRADRLAQAIESYLARWAKAAKKDWPDVPFLGTDAARRCVALSPMEGWCCILEADPYRADFELASYLSVQLGTTCVAVELRGAELAWRYAVFEDGVCVREEADPAELFEPVPPSGDGPMPLYPDATREVMRVLRAEGIPVIYRLLRQTDLIGEVGVDLRHVTAAVEVLVGPEKRTALSVRKGVLYGIRRGSGDVPFPPDLTGSGDDHEELIFEVRMLFGHADAHAVDNLLEVERADRNRLLGHYLGRPGGYVPEVRFEYSSRGADDDELRALVERRRAALFAVRPPKVQFLEMALRIAREEFDGWKDVSPSGFGLRFKRGRIEDSVDLEAPYEGFMEGRLAAPSPEAALRCCLRQAAGDLEGSAVVMDFDAVSDLLLPYLVAGDEGERVRKDGVQTAPVGHGLSVAVVCQVGEGSALIDSEDLERWGIDLDGALAAARKNLEDRMRRDSRALLPVDISPGKKALAYLAGGQSAALILVPGLSRILSELMRTTDILCAIPDQDSLFAVPGADKDAEQDLRKFARERMLAAERPLTAELFRIKDGELSEA